MINEKLENEIREYLVGSNGKMIAARALPNVLKKRGYYDYLLQRYSDNTTTEFCETLYRFVNNIDEIPVCPECGKRITFSLANRIYPNWCSPKCRNNSAEVKKKNASGVSKSLKKVYVERKSEIQEKRAKTLNEKYGGNFDSGSPFSYKEIKDSAKETVKERYGVENVLSLGEFRKTKETFRQKSVDLWKSRGLDIEYTDNDTIIVKNGCPKHGDIELTLVDFNNRTRAGRINASGICPLCNPINYNSGEESALKFFLDDNGIKYSCNDRSIIKPYELDFYIPEKKLAIEMNGIYFHSELHGKPKQYHKMKTDMCENMGIRLIHIWEDNWKMKHDIVLSMLKSKLGIMSDRIFARNCAVKEVDSETARQFCEDNHLQGYVNSKYKFGLFYNNELVSLMTFGKCRPILNDKNGDEHSCELYRFCNKLNIRVIGGASKLLSYAKDILKQEGISVIYTFAQRDWADGSFYEKLGFEKIGVTEPNYFYCNDSKERLSRYSCMKHKLGETDETLTEEEIMRKRGYFKCYDSGNIKFKLNI